MYHFLLRSSTIRLGIFISTLVIAVILIFQVTWLKRVYHYEQKEFDLGVVKSIRGVYEDLDISDYYSSHLSELIEKPESHLYLAQVSLPVNQDSLVYYLQYELDDFGIFTDCHIGIYDAASDKYIFTDVLASPGSTIRQKANLPRQSRNFSYLAFYFPNRQKYILSQMNFWIYSSAFLLVVLILLSAGLYYFFRQKFLNETQKDFIHNFTHEFKTPVAVISLAADVLKSENIAEKPARLSTYASIVEQQSHYLQAQIEKLLEFAYMDSGQLHLKKEKINIHDVINQAISNLTPIIHERNAEIIYELEAEFPVILADKGYMLITVTNLLDNAIKYSKDPRICISTKNEDQTLLLSVKDNGIGIDKKQLKKIFRKFYRVKNGETYSAKGFGLGLSFVKTILTTHGGKIKIESTPGVGSVFTVQLPVN